MHNKKAYQALLVTQELEAAKEKDWIEHEQKIEEHNMEQDRRKREHAKVFSHHQFGAVA